MPKARVSTQTTSTKSRKALTPEAREKQLINLAMDCAEQQLRDGTASSQVITHFLKQATVKAELELEKMRIENKKTEAQIKSLESADEMKLIAENAIKAMQNYKGLGDPDEYEDY